MAHQATHRRALVPVFPLALCLATLLAACAGGTGGAAHPSPTATPAVRLPDGLGRMTLYVATHAGGAGAGVVDALAADTGAVRWTFRTGAMYGAPALADGAVFVAPQDGNVYALDAAGGKQLWAFRRDEAVDGYAAVSGGTVYVTSDEGAVYALDAKTGALRWQFRSPDAKDHIYAAPAVADGMVYVSSGGTTDAFYALDAGSGHVRWEAHAASGFDGVPLAADGVVYVGANDDALHALRDADGRVLWRFQTQGAIISRPAVAGGMVYVGTTDRQLYALDAASGAKRWSFRAAGDGQQGPGSLPTGAAPDVADVADGVVYVSSAAGTVTALDAASGAQRWQYADGSNLSPPPLVAGGAVFVAGDDGTVHALLAATGAVAWSYAAGGSIFGASTLG